MDFNEILSKIQTGNDLLKKSEFPMFDYSSIVHNIESNIQTVEIDEESTFPYQMQQQTNQIIEKSNEQIALLVKQNEQLSINYQKLEDLYKIKERELEETKREAKKVKIRTTILSLVAIVIAIAAWLFPNFDIIQIIGMLFK